jgi:UDP-N-acetylglucosamine 3-dehydrogenase
MKRVNVGVIGVGLFGELHARVYFESPKCNLLAVADAKEQKAEEVAAKYHASAYSDWCKLLERKDIEAVSIVTPEDQHTDVAIAAAERGKHILVEKPIATRIRDAVAIINAAKKNGVKLMVGHILRFTPAYVQVKQAIESGRIGEPIWSFSKRNGTVAQVERLKGRVSAGKFLGVHDADLVRWYMNDEPERVYAEDVKSVVHNKYGVSDFIWALVKFKRGGVGSIETGWGLPKGWGGLQHPSKWTRFDADVGVEVIGTAGSVRIDYPPMLVYGCDETGFKYPDIIHGYEVHGKINGGIRIEIEHFLESVLDNSEPLVTGEDGLAALKIIEAAEISASENRPVQMTEVESI